MTNKASLVLWQRPYWLIKELRLSKLPKKTQCTSSKLQYNLQCSSTSIRLAEKNKTTTRLIRFGRIKLPGGRGDVGEGCAGGKCDGDAVFGVRGVEVPEDYIGKTRITDFQFGTRTVQLLRRVRQRLVEYR